MKICVGNALEKVIQKYFGGQPRGGAPSALDGHKRDFQPSKLNPSKSEFLWCLTLRRRHLLDDSTFALADADRSPPSRRHPQPRSLFGSCMTRTAHVSQLVRGCFTNCVGSKPSVNSFRPQPLSSRSTASSSPELTTATAYWKVCRFVN